MASPGQTRKLEVVSIVGERVRGVLRVATAALQRGEMYIYPSDVRAVFDAIGAMLDEFDAVLGKVDLSDETSPGLIYRPGRGPSKAWPKEGDGEERDAA